MNYCTSSMSLLVLHDNFFLHIARHTVHGNKNDMMLHSSITPNPAVAAQLHFTQGKTNYLPWLIIRANIQHFPRICISDFSVR